MCADDYVYIGSDDKKFYCIDTRYGKKMWDFQTGSRVGSSPCAAKGFVYFGSSDKKFYCLNNRTGIKAWEFETGGEYGQVPLLSTGSYISEVMIKNSTVLIQVNPVLRQEIHSAGRI
jgi:outer membrane protein assembly factor BamB